MTEALWIGVQSAIIGLPIFYVIVMAIWVLLGTLYGLTLSESFRFTWYYWVKGKRDD